MAVGLTLRLVRHGQTDWSAQGRYTGRTDVELNAEGRKQAAALAAIAVGPYDSIWCSELLRCVQTAQLMGVEAVAVADLREFDFGELEGKRWVDLDDGARQGLLDFDGLTAPGGESVAGFAQRIDRFVAELGRGRHLLVTHGGVVRHLLRRTGTDADVRPGTWRDIDIDDHRT